MSEDRMGIGQDRRAESALPKMSQHVFVASSHALRTVMDSVERVAVMPRVPVLLLGETGAGKEAVAMELHRATRDRHAWRDGRFEKVNLSGMASTMIEDELFGHKRGAFTGASEDRDGLLKSADAGTIFLDEIGDLDMSLQGKLHNFLDDYHVRPIGSNRGTLVDVRVVAATNVNLAEAVKQKKFREDLYYRLAAVSIRVPSLREHPEDIPKLFSTFVRKINEENRMSLATEAADNVVEKLSAYPWPGNVRELYHALCRAAMVSDGKVLRVENFNLETAASGAYKPGNEAAAPPDSNPFHIGEMVPLKMVRQAVEKAHIAAVLEKCGYHKSRAGQILGLHRPSLYSLMRRHEIAAPFVQTRPKEAAPAGRPAQEQPPAELSILTKYLEALPDFDRQVFSSRYGLSGNAQVLSVEEVSELFGLFPSSIRNILDRGWRRLAKVDFPYDEDWLLAIRNR